MSFFSKLIPGFFALGLVFASTPSITRADNDNGGSKPIATLLPTPTITVPPGQPSPTNALPKNWTGEKIYVFDTLFGTKGSDLNQLNGPEGICVGPDGNLYIADTQNSRILEWTCDGKPIKSIGSYGPSATWRNDPQFDHPAGVLVVPDGQIYVADTQNNRIVLLDPNGLVNLSWGRLGTRHRQFTAPRVVAKDHFGNIWVLDSGNSRVSNFSNMGKFNFTWGSFGTQPGSLNFPLGMALNNIDQGILTDTGNFRIQVFNDQSPPSAMDQSPVTTDSGGTTIEPTPVDYSPVTVEGWYGDGPGQFKEPAGVVVTKGKLIVVADGLTGRVNIFNARFDFISEWRAADETLNLASPPHFRGMACDSQNRIYITDIQNNCIIRLKPVTAPDALTISGGDTPVATETPVPPTPTPEDSSPFGGGFPIR
jgi:streptogramin lyase